METDLLLWGKTPPGLLVPKQKASCPQGWGKTPPIYLYEQWHLLTVRQLIVQQTVKTDEQTKSTELKHESMRSLEGICQHNYRKCHQIILIFMHRRLISKHEDIRIRGHEETLVNEHFIS